ncbi:hypothetical protein SAMN05518800_1909 [Variovorax sp. YR752]|uniref:hypothetical protein n=1 Tax=Variovorax sp. YR752 TaxID=1884383 RepID=UPI000BD2EAE6|nr:hypothetical protein [Variovorax sp. YR752]SOD25439.1 hypothetical protein SAMN05518800_1909 [Variovorax sp. YR752]
MSNRQGFLLGLVVLAVLIPLVVVLYRKLHAGKPQTGLHIQTAGISLAWIGGVIALALDQVELGAKAIFLGFLIGIVGLFVHTQSTRKEKDRQD